MILSLPHTVAPSRPRAARRCRPDVLQAAPTWWTAYVTLASSLYTAFTRASLPPHRQLRRRCSLLRLRTGTGHNVVMKALKAGMPLARGVGRIWDRLVSGSVRHARSPPRTSTSWGTLLQRGVQVIIEILLLQLCLLLFFYCNKIQRGLYPTVLLIIFSSLYLELLSPTDITIMCLYKVFSRLGCTCNTRIQCFMNFCLQHWHMKESFYWRLVGPGVDCTWNMSSLFTLMISLM
jgi:hypothetical protein